MNTLWIPLALCLTCTGGWAAAPSMSPSTPEAKPSAAPAPRNLTALEAAKLLADDKSVRILDIRTPEEFHAGHLRGATNIDFYAASFQTQVAALDPSHPWLLHCATGRRSAKARDALAKLGRHTLYHLDGGLSAWQKAGLPVVR